MTPDDVKLEAMLALSDKARDPNDYWLSRQNQKKLVFSIALRSYQEFDMSAEDAIKGAREFIDTYYKMEIQF